MYTLEQKQWITKRIAKILNTADTCKLRAPYI